MPYVPRTHQMLPARLLGGVMTKIHIVNYPTKSEHLEKDLQQAFDCVDKITAWPDCKYGFFILHRTETNVFVTSGRWVDGNVLWIDFAGKGLMLDLETMEEADKEITEDYNASGGFCIWDLKIIGFERDTYVSNMIEPGIPNPDGYLACQMTGNTV